MTYADFLKAVRTEVSSSGAALCSANADTLQILRRKAQFNLEKLDQHSARLREAIRAELRRLEDTNGRGAVYLHTAWNDQRATYPLSVAQAKARRLELLDAWIAVETCMDALAPMRQALKARETVWCYANKGWKEVQDFTEASHPFDYTLVKPGPEAALCDPHADLRLAHKNGAEIEYRNDAAQAWRTATHPQWAPSREYRIKPEPTLAELRQAWAKGLDVEVTYRTGDKTWQTVRCNPEWNFVTYKYRISPDPSYFVDLKAAHRAGALIQYWDKEANRWRDCDPAIWYRDTKYRVKPSIVKARFIWWRPDGGKGSAIVIMVTEEDQARDPRDKWAGFVGWASDWIECDPSDLK